MITWLGIYKAEHVGNDVLGRRLRNPVTAIVNAEGISVHDL